MRRSLLTGILFLLLGIPQLFACQCKVLPGITKAVAEQYDVIFTGTVLAVSPGDVESKARFKIIALYRGSAYQEIDLEYDNVGDCSLNFVPGETWTIYGKWIKYGVPRADWCLHSRKKMNAGESDYYMMDGRPSYEEEVKLLGDSLGVQPFIDPTQTQDQLHKNILPGATEAFTYLIVGFVGLSLIFYFVRRMFKRDGK